MKDVEDAMAKLRQRYIAAVAKRDVDALIQLYDPKVRVFDAWQAWEYAGADAWRIAVEGWLSSNPGERLQVGFDDVAVAGGPELATMTALVSYAGYAPDGTESHAMHNRMTWVVRTAGHNLRILHEHSSAPIGFADAKAILKRAV